MSVFVRLFARPLAAVIVLGFAQMALAEEVQGRDPALKAYFSIEAGQGKVGFTCRGVRSCSPIDTSARWRFGYRLTPQWATELTVHSVSSDVFLGSPNDAAKVGSISLNAVYSQALANRLNGIVRLGLASTRTEFRLGSDLLGDPSPPATIARTVQPLLGLGASWQFARQWSLDLNADWTRARLQQLPDGPKSWATVRSLHLGVGFHF